MWDDWRAIEASQAEALRVRERRQRDAELRMWHYRRGHGHAPSNAVESAWRAEQARDVTPAASEPPGPPTTPVGPLTAEQQDAIDAATRRHVVDVRPAAVEPPATAEDCLAGCLRRLLDRGNVTRADVAHLLELHP
jgi:hypothetical protein